MMEIVLPVDTWNYETQDCSSKGLNLDLNIRTPVMDSCYRRVS